MWCLVFGLVVVMCGFMWLGYIFSSERAAVSGRFAIYKLGCPLFPLVFLNVVIFL